MYSGRSQVKEEGHGHYVVMEPAMDSVHVANVKDLVN